MRSDEIRALTDEELIERFSRTRAHEFLDEIVRRYYRRVLAGSTAVLRDPGEAEHVTQDTFVRVFTSPSRFNGGNFRAWLFRVAKNLSLDALRRRQPAVELTDSVVAPSDDVAQRLAEVEQVLGLLSAPQRICLKLLYGEGLSYAEIVERTGYPLKAVNSYVQNGRERFKRLWEKRAGGGAGA